MKINYWHQLEHNCFYHLYNRSISDSKLFKGHSDYLALLKKFKEYCTPYFHVYAYCLIPNHFHFIIKVKSQKLIKEIVQQETFDTAQKYLNKEITINDYLSNQLKRLFSSYALSFNNKHNRKGPLFQNKVKRIFIENDDRLRYLIGYVHHNPIHHHLAENYISWKYSSYKALVSTKSSNLAKERVHLLYQSLNGFQEFHNRFKLEKKEDKFH